MRLNPWHFNLGHKSLNTVFVLSFIQKTVTIFIQVGRYVTYKLLIVGSYFLQKSKISFPKHNVFNFIFRKTYGCWRISASFVPFLKFLCWTDVFLGSFAVLLLLPVNCPLMTGETRVCIWLIFSKKYVCNKESSLWIVFCLITQQYNLGTFEQNFPDIDWQVSITFSSSSNILVFFLIYELSL